jgi:GNAT superfamily N-acetyltransferase
LFVEVFIEKGEAKDLPAVLGLIHELAEYERAPQEVTITLDDLVNDFSAEQKSFDFFTAKVNGKVVGMALYFFSYSTWKGRALYMEDIIVTEAYRRSGIGSKLFKAVIRVAKEENVKRMAWQALDWNEPAINFYKKYNAEADPEWINFRFGKEGLDSFTGI